MKVKDVICSEGRSGYMHRDLAAIKSGTATPDGSLFRGKPLSPGFTRIIEPATIISVMLVLEDGQIAFGDCADVILAGVAGRDPAFNARGHIDYVRGEVADALRGRDVSKFKDSAAEMNKDEPSKGRRQHNDIAMKKHGGHDEGGDAAEHRARHLGQARAVGAPSTVSDTPRFTATSSIE